MCSEDFSSPYYHTAELELHIAVGSVLYAAGRSTVGAGVVLVLVLVLVLQFLLRLCADTAGINIYQRFYLHIKQIRCSKCKQTTIRRRSKLAAAIIITAGRREVGRENIL